MTPPTSGSASRSFVLERRELTCRGDRGSENRHGVLIPLVVNRCVLRLLDANATFSIRKKKSEAIVLRLGSTTFAQKKNQRQVTLHVRDRV